MSLVYFPSCKFRAAFPSAAQKAEDYLRARFGACISGCCRSCRELLEGAPGDTFGIAGYCVPPMYRQGLADAMEKMCASRARREEMGRIGQRRVDAYFHHEQMLANYQKMYDETAKEYHLE